MTDKNPTDYPTQYPILGGPVEQQRPLDDEDVRQIKTDSERLRTISLEGIANPQRDLLGAALAAATKESMDDMSDAAVIDWYTTVYQPTHQ